jgi:hypothetical protein
MPRYEWLGTTLIRRAGGAWRVTLNAFQRALTCTLRVQLNLNKCFPTPASLAHQPLLVVDICLTIQRLIAEVEGTVTNHRTFPAETFRTKIGSHDQQFGRAFLCRTQHHGTFLASHGPSPGPKTSEQHLDFRSSLEKYNFIEI